jgi:hypothetical protein
LGKHLNWRNFWWKRGETDTQSVKPLGEEKNTCKRLEITIKRHVRERGKGGGRRRRRRKREVRKKETIKRRKIKRRFTDKIRQSYKPS